MHKPARILGIIVASIAACVAQAQELADSANPELLLIPVSTVTAPAAAAPASGTRRQIEEVIVTSQKTEQSLQDVPISVTAVDGDFLREVGASNIADVAAYIPNLKFSSDSDPALTQISIRGFGTSPLNSAFESSVGFVQDEIFFGRSPYTTEALFDIDRIEVLRGPQGTLFGKNTTAGVFNVFTRRPGEHFSGDVRLNISDPQERRLEAGVGGMFSSWGGLRLSLLELDRNGGENFNTKLDRAEDQVRQQAQRIKLVLLPLADVEMELNAVNSKTDTTYWPLQLSNLDDSTLAFLRNYDPEIEDDGYNHQLSQDFPGFIDKSSHTVGLTTKWTIGSLGAIDDLKSVLVLGYSQMDLDAPPDLDNSPADIARLRTTWNYHQRSAELRFTGNFDDGLLGFGQRLDFIVGGFLMDADYQQTTRVEAGRDLAAYVLTGSALRQVGGGNSTLPLPGIGALGQLLSGVTAPLIGEDAVTLDYLLNTKTTAVFAQSTWRLNRHWALTPGIRYNREEKIADASGTSECTAPPLCLIRLALGARDYQAPGVSRQESDFSPKLSLQYFWNDDITLFASYTRGFKSGGINAASFTGDNLQFEPETVLSLESGIKSTLFDRTLNFNATVFRTTFDDLQTLSIDGAFINVGNAATAISQGLEVDFLWLTPLQVLTVSGSLGLLDATYDSFPGAQATVDMPSGSTQDLSGRTLTFAPKQTASLTPTVSLPLFGYIMQASIDWLYQGAQFTDIDLDPNTRVPAQSLWSARVSLADPGRTWSVTLGGSNLTDQDYAGQVVDTAFFPGSYAVTQQPGRKLFAAFTLGF